MELNEENQQTVKPHLNQVEISSGSNTYEPVAGLSDEQNRYEQTKEESWEKVLPTQFAELEYYLGNDGYLSNEEIATAMQNEQLERQRQIQELERQTGEKINPKDYPTFVTINPTIYPMNNQPETDGALKIDPLELSKLNVKPSFLFARDDKGDIKVVSQEPETKKFGLKDTKSDVSLMDAFPKVFTDKGMLAAFLENFNNARAATEQVITKTGNKLSELIRGKVDLVMVNAKEGYPASLGKAKAMFSTTDVQQEITAGVQKNKEDSKMQNDVKTKFKESDVNWSQLEKIGVTKDRLEVTGQLNKYLNGERTNLIDPSSLKEGQKYILENTPFALQLKDGPNGPGNHMLFKEAKLSLPDTYQGQKLSVEDKMSLLTKQHLGKLLDIGGKPHFVSVDKDLNQLSHREADTIRIPSKIKLANGSEILLTKDQQKLLSEGKPAEVANLKDNKGQSFTGHLIVNAASGKLDVMKEVAPSMTQTAIQNQDKKQVQQNNEGARVKQNPIPNKGRTM
jgi:uncharacterized phage-like protein YoqJ